MTINNSYFSELSDEYKKLDSNYPYYKDYEKIFLSLNRNKKRNEKIEFPIYEMFSYEMQDFCNYWIDKLVNGMSVGGKMITGEHLFYLNCINIDVTKEFDNKITKSRKSGYRTTDFPDFWDEDFKYFWTCEIAKYGIQGCGIESYNDFCNKHFDLGLINEIDNLSGGLNHLWLKPRGVGASWKGGAKANHNLFLKPDSKTFIFAEKEQYLGNKDGFFTKFNYIRSFIQSKCWFLRKDFITEKNSDYLFQTGYKEIISGGTLNKGFNSLVAGIVIDGDSDKGRGKRGDAIFEEFGSFPTVNQVWNKYEESSNEYGIVHGQARGFGTGGDSKKGFGTVEGYEALKKMFYDPSSYNIIKFLDVYEDIGAGRDLGMFTPAYRNITDKDEDGFSIETIGKEKLDKRRKEWLESKDSELYSQKCAELPYIPKEAFNITGDNIYPIELLNEQFDYVSKNGLDKKFVTTGIMQSNVFVPKTLIQYNEYPAKSGNKDSCVCMFQEPHRVNGVIPDNLYMICCDPFRNDNGGSSIGSIYVIENVNVFTKYKGDVISAWYNGRPSDDSEQVKFCQILFGLAEFYNCKIGIEIGAESYVLSYAKNKSHLDSKGRRLTIYLEESFELATDEKIIRKKNISSNTFGMSMNAERKLQGHNYLKDWLLKPRGISNSKTIRNINYIFDLGLLKELISYSGNNADRISAMIIGCFYMREITYKSNNYNKTWKNDSFFKKELFR